MGLEQGKCPSQSFTLSMGMNYGMNCGNARFMFCCSTQPTQSDQRRWHFVGSLTACWWAQFGQLGNGSTEDANAPQVIEALADKKAKLISCGWRHTVAVTEDGQVYSWGRGVHGQLGHGELVDL